MRSSPMLTATSRGVQPYCIDLRFLFKDRTLVLFSQVRNDDRDKATLGRVTGPKFGTAPDSSASD